MKKKINITLEDTLIRDINLAQKELTGSANLSGLIEKLLFDWFEGFKLIKPHFNLFKEINKNNTSITKNKIKEDKKDKS